jgi:uncharacterized protein (DUF4415 family)
MNANYHDDKDRKNRETHDLSLSEADGIDWLTAITTSDNRRDYGEVRYIHMPCIVSAFTVLYGRGEERISALLASAKRMRKKVKNMKKKKTEELPIEDRPLTEEEWDAMGPWMHGLEELPADARAAIERSRGRPKMEHPKRQVTLRLDADLLDAYKATGRGWQTRVNEALRKHMPK